MQTPFASLSATELTVQPGAQCVQEQNLGRPSSSYFLLPLVRQARCKVSFIINRHLAHRSRLVCVWLMQHADCIEMFFCPAHSQELNHSLVSLSSNAH